MIRAIPSKAVLIFHRIFSISSRVYIVLNDSEATFVREENDATVRPFLFCALLIDCVV